MTIRIEEPFLSESASHVLHRLGALREGLGMQLPEKKGWQRGAAELVERGFAEEVIGYFALTDAGRSQLRNNQGEPSPPARGRG